MYKKNLLREYIQNSCQRTFKDLIYVRLSEELAKNYDNGLYNNYLNCLYDSYKQLLSLNLKQPCNGIPNLYVYIVPDNNYAELLSFPEKFNKGTGGGKPVKCYNLDGYICIWCKSEFLC